jgi:RNA polymerase sigma-70 factor, ECF subfamily
MKSTRREGVSGQDKTDIAASLNGDGEAFARILRRYQGEIAAYMWRFTRETTVCEELVHDVFVEAFFSLGSFQGKAPFLHWLRKIATRVGYRHWKKRTRERAVPTVPLEEATLAQTPFPATEDPETASKHLQRVLSRLPPRDHLVLTLLYLEECSVQEAADLLGWSRAMVKVQAYRARKKLLQLLRPPRGG